VKHLQHVLRTTLLFAVSLAVMAIVGTTPAWAHAELVDARPAAGEVLVESPEQIVLRWNEAVTTSAEQLTLIDARGSRVATKVVAGRFVDEATITPVSPLGDGRWTVSWKAVSGDGHLVSGAYIFAVGDVILTSGDTLSVSGSAVGASDRVLETISWLGLLIALGATWAHRRRVAAIVALVTTVLVATRVMMFIDASGTGFASTFSAVGEVRSSIAVGFGAFGVALASIWASERTKNLAVVVGLTGFVAQGLFSGHHLDFENGVAVVATVAHLAHLFAGAVWVSAVIALVFDRSKEQLVQVARRSTVAVIVLFPSAFVLAVLLGLPTGELGGGPWLTNLLVKAALVGIALALGAAHHRSVLRGGGVRLTTLVVELAVMAAVFAASATLTQHTPPAVLHTVALIERGTDAMKTEAESSHQGDPIDATFDDGSRVTLHVPGKGGEANGMWMLDLRSREGGPLDAQTVQATASNQRAGIDVLPLSFAGAGDHWMGINTLPFPGTWKISVDVFLDEFTVISAELIIEAQENSK
jgi:copper transport protein